MFQELIEIQEDLIISKEDPPFLVAEIGLNHNNDLDIGKRTIEAAAKSGAHAVKFQSYKTDHFISPDEAKAKFLYDIFLKYELDEKMHREFQQTAKDNGVVFFSTPLDCISVDLLVSMDVPIIKIASGDLVNSELLDKVAKTKLPIFLSTGASNLSEVIRALEFLKDRDVNSLCLMHCVSLYPAPAETLNLNTINLYKDFTEGPLGFSDHSKGELAAGIAVSMDASVIEKHFTLDKNLEGPDHGISADPSELRKVADTIKLAFEMKGSRRKILHPKEEASYLFGRRSLYHTPSGDILSMRPNLSIEDHDVWDAWEFIHLDAKNFSKKTKNFTAIKRSDG